MNPPDCWIIGIAGGSASGKTRVAHAIVEELGQEEVQVIDQDSYYCDLSDLPLDERKKQNFDHPSSFDGALLFDHLTILRQGGWVEKPVYDYTAHTRSARTERVGGHSVLVLEGILVLDDPRLRALMSIKVFIDTDPDVRLIRRLRRDVTERGRSVESVLTQYEASVRPMHQQFVEPSKRYADIIIPEGVENHVGVDILRTKVHALASSSARGQRPADLFPTGR
ncbi:MAG: uridine kinase [Candidatus Eisenbacteria bacterium]|nr:uridine kinase [Candidatus Eisenbacteria bacterium]